MRRDWVGHDYNTGKTLFRAVGLETSSLVYIFGIFFFINNFGVSIYHRSINGLN